LSLKWLLRILNLLMRCSKVEGDTRSLAAAPLGPDTRPRLPASASSMICRSRLGSASASAGSGCCGKLTRRESLDNQAASTQNTPSELGVSRYRVVVEVTLHDRFEPCPGLRNGIVHTLAELLCPRALANRHASHGESPIPVLSTDVRKTQKVERLRFSFSPLLPVSFGIPPELDPARLVSVEFQPELSKPLPEQLQIAVCFRSVLKSQ